MFISISLLGMFGAIYYFTQQEKQDLVDVKAIIVDLLEVSSGKVQPVVEYTWGEEVLIDTIDFAVDSGEFEFGEVIDVLIHPDYPDDVILEKSLTADLFDIQGTNDDVSELQWMEFIQNGFIYVLLVPGLLLFVFSIFLWWLGGKVGGK